MVDNLSDTTRGNNGFGSTDKRVPPPPTQFPINHLPPPTVIAAEAATARSLATVNTIMSDSL